MLRDIGANLTSNKFSSDLDSVLRRAQEAGVAFIDVTGVDVESSQTALALARRHPGLLGATAGVHPHAAARLDEGALEALGALLAEPEVLMCGEMGLDYARSICEPNLQRRAFDAQLELAASLNKPLFLHCRDAFDDFFKALDRHPQLWSRSIVHCFTGGPEQARACAERGAYFGVTGWVADKRRNGPLLQALPLIPMDRLLLETDAPYLIPLNRPKTQARDRNEPSLLPWVASAVAQSLGASIEDVIQASWINAERLIGRGPSSQPHQFRAPNP
jgi:TatD DNase family protein